MKIRATMIEGWLESREKCLRERRAITGKNHPRVITRDISLKRGISMTIKARLIILIAA